MNNPIPAFDLVPMPSEASYLRVMAIRLKNDSAAESNGVVAFFLPRAARKQASLSETGFRRLTGGQRRRGLRVVLDTCSRLRVAGNRGRSEFVLSK